MSNIGELSRVICETFELWENNMQDKKHLIHIDKSIEELKKNLKALPMEKLIEIDFIKINAKILDLKYELHKMHVNNYSDSLNIDAISLKTNELIAEISKLKELSHEDY